jgi:hypothetical protein
MMDVIVDVVQVVIDDRLPNADTGRLLSKSRSLSNSHRSPASLTHPRLARTTTCHTCHTHRRTKRKLSVTLISIAYVFVSRIHCSRITTFPTVHSPQRPLASRYYLIVGLSRLLRICRHHCNRRLTSQTQPKLFFSVDEQQQLFKYSPFTGHSQVIHRSFTVHSRVKRLQPIARRVYARSLSGL